MPIFVALMASAVLHVSMLLSEGWALPNMSEVEELDVVLAPPPARKLPEAPPAPVVKAPSAPVKPRNEPAPPLLAPADIAASSAAPAPVALAGTETPEDAALAAPTQADAPALAPSAQALASSASPTPAPVILATALARLPVKAIWRYTVTRGEGGLLIGEATYGWEQDSGRYKATSRTETIGIAALFVSAQITQESMGELDDTGLHPASYRHVQPKRTDSAELDRVRGVVLSNQREMPLRDTAARVQDLLSMYYQLGLLLATLDPVPAEIELPLATGRKLESYRFAVLGEERLSRQLNDYLTRHLQARNGRDIIDLWFAPEFPLPLRMRFADRKGDVYEQWLVLPN